MTSRVVRRYRWRLVATGVAVIAVVAGLNHLDVVNDPQQGRDGAVRVATAVRDLPPGHVISGADVDMVEVPPSMLPDGAGETADALVGRTVTLVVMRGDIITGRRLAPAGLGPTAALVPAGHRAVAVPVGGAVPPLAVGDRIDLLVAGPLSPGTRPGDITSGRTDASAPVRAVVRDVVVLDTGTVIGSSTASAGSAGGITVVVPIDQLPAVIAATQQSVVVPVLAGN
jgi:Flp pilus assembly protein CpaB